MPEMDTVEYYKQEIEKFWLDFKQACEGVKDVKSIQEAVDLRKLCEHRLYAFDFVVRGKLGMSKELRNIPSGIKDKKGNEIAYDLLCYHRSCQGMDWILKLQYAIDKRCQRRDCADHGHLLEVSNPAGG